VAVDVGVRPYPGGKFWRTIRNLHLGKKSRILVIGRRFEYIPIGKGVAQGDPLSFALYAIFENALLGKLHAGRRIPWMQASLRFCLQMTWLALLTQ
jgi:hypothetical protein